MGIPLASWNPNACRKNFTGLSVQVAARHSTAEILCECWGMEGASAKIHLWRVVDDDCVAEVAAEYGEILHVVALHIDAGISEDAVSDEASLGVKHVQQLLGVHLRYREPQRLNLGHNYKIGRSSDNFEVRVLKDVFRSASLSVCQPSPYQLQFDGPKQDRYSVIDLQASSLST